jgi:histidine triad (HIT) family protein
MYNIFMDDCIFCKIVSGEIPCYKVYEDKDFLGFLDIQPLSPGNVLLIPKIHYRWVYDVPNFGEYWEAARKVGKRIIKSMGATSINFMTIGEEVPHAHIRIIPRYTNDKMPFEIFPKKLPEEEMKKILIKINSAI